MFGLEDRAGSLAAQLSKGMKQKVAIARALLHSPPVILLDEPTSGLDPQTARLVRELVLTLRDRGHTIIISTHNLDEAERVSSRIGVLQRRLIALDTPDALRRRLFGHRVRVRLAAARAAACRGRRAGRRSRSPGARGRLLARMDECRPRHAGDCPGAGGSGRRRPRRDSGAGAARGRVPGAHQRRRQEEASS